ncbi:MAG: DUF6440 family protein [Oscillospiraceae bacterium]|jgi:hypothetical protein|nr:DUF6440 family protein [Oscillospiraceae bacterium]
MEDLNERFRLIKSGKFAMSGYEIIIDKVTGVNYLFRFNGYSGGLTVLVDENGKPIVTEKTY